MSTADELAKLHDLLNKGAITQDEFESAKARVLAGASPSSTSSSELGAGGLNAFRLSRDDRWIAGVCGGLAQLTGLDSWAWRLLFVLGLMLGGATLLVYVLLWIFVPREAVDE